MKTITLSLILITLTSCLQEAPQHKAVFKFYNADTNAEIKSAQVMIKLMEQNKVYRLDLTNGECSNYTNNK